MKNQFIFVPIIRCIHWVFVLSIRHFSLPNLLNHPPLFIHSQMRSIGILNWNTSSKNPSHQWNLSMFYPKTTSLSGYIILPLPLVQHMAAAFLTENWSKLRSALFHQSLKMPTGVLTSWNKTHLLILSWFLMIFVSWEGCWYSFLVELWLSLKQICVH